LGRRGKHKSSKGALVAEKKKNLWTSRYAVVGRSGTDYQDQDIPWVEELPEGHYSNQHESLVRKKHFPNNKAFERTDKLAIHKCGGYNIILTTVKTLTFASVQCIDIAITGQESYKIKTIP
jgi:hypothetical protein